MAIMSTTGHLILVETLANIATNCGSGTRSKATKCSISNIDILATQFMAMFGRDLEEEEQRWQESSGMSTSERLIRVNN